jgi:hyperosmotically inducible protein
MMKEVTKGLIVLLSLILALAQPIVADNAKVFAQQKVSHTRGPRTTETGIAPSLLAAEVRHRLLMLPYYDVFDWLEGEVRPDGTLVLRGQVVRPTLKADAEKSAGDVTGIKRVLNEIEVLPLSSSDIQLRVALYRAIYKFDSPLFRYATRAVPPIHIIVKGGHAILKGVVATKADSDLAYIAARGVPGLFEVTNELRAEDQMPR